MKKNVIGWASFWFICGITFILIGIFIITTPHGSIIFGIGCSFIGGSTATFYKYFHGLNPKNKLHYEEHLKNEKTNLYDERKIMLRDKSGRITYTIMFVVLTILFIFFTFMGVERWIILTLGGVIAFQCRSGA